MFRTGDTVMITALTTSKWAGTGPWKIIKINPRKYKLSLISDPLMVLNADHSLVVSAVSTSPANREVTAAGTSESVPLDEGNGVDTLKTVGGSLNDRPAGLRIGAIVTTKSPLSRWGFTTSTLFVVFKDDFTQVKIVPLGGDANRRFWRVPAQAVTVVDPARLTLGPKPLDISHLRQL